MNSRAQTLRRSDNYLDWVHNPSLVAVAILLLGAVLRFMQLGDIRYGYDHSFPAYQALQLLDGRQIPLIGQPSSVFLDNPVLMAYIQAIPLLIARSPWSVFIFTIALNSLAIWFIYLLARDILGVRVGLVAAFLFAINPWVIFFSRSSWVQSLLPFLMAVIAWGLWPAFIQPGTSAKRFFVGGAAVTLLTQTYVQAWGLLPQLALLLVLFRRFTPKRAFWVAVAFFLLAGLLYAGGLATRWEVNSGKLSNFISADTWTLTTIGGRHALRLITGIDFEQAYAVGDLASTASPFRSALSLVDVVVLTVATVAGIGRALFALRRSGIERRIAIVLLVWFFMPVLLTAVAGSSPIHPHYLLLTVPAGHILATWGLLPLLQRKAWTAVAVTSLLLIGLLFTHDLLQANQNVARQPVWPEFDGWSLAAGAEAGRTIRELLDPNASYPRRIVAKGDKALLSGLSGTYLDPVNGVSYPDFVLLPPGENLLYAIEGDATVPEWLRPFVVPRPERTLTFANGAPVSFVQTDAAAVQAMETYPENQVTLPTEAGITLLGYTIHNPQSAIPNDVWPGQSFGLLTYWRVDALHPERGGWYVSASYHLVNDQEQIVANAGEHGQYAHRWQLGDVYVERVTIQVPADAAPGRYRLDIGLFDVLRSHAYSFFAPNTVESHFSIAVNVRPPEEAHLYYTPKDE
jgi:4-amino-4-deoxy-L-arabinose transferase-like glycosyltransferase